MADARFPNLPPQVVEALKRGDKAAAMKLMKELAGKAKPAKAAGAAKVFKHHHAPPVLHDPRRPGLSPGEVPRTGAGFGWLLLVAIAILAIIAVLPKN